MVAINKENPKLNIYPREYMGDYVVEVKSEINNYRKSLICSAILLGRGIISIDLSNYILNVDSVYYFTVKSTTGELIWAGKGIVMGPDKNIENYQPFEVTDKNIIKI